jgi:hypothetical protein
MHTQVLGMPPRERQALQSALDKIGTAAGTGMAALVTDGWYLAGTSEWWMMASNELLLLQQIATFMPEVCHHCTVNLFPMSTIAVEFAVVGVTVDIRPGLVGSRQVLERHYVPTLCTVPL